MGLIRLLFAGIVFAGLTSQGCSRDGPAPAHELVTVEPARVAFNDDFAVHVAMRKQEGLGVSIFKAGAAETAPALTSQPLDGNEDILTAKFGTVRLKPGDYLAAVTDNTGKRLAGAEFSVTEPTAKTRIGVMRTGIYPGDPIEVTWRGGSGEAADWIGIYKMTEPNLASYLARLDTGVSGRGTATFGADAFSVALTPGKYEARLMRDGGYVELANAKFVVSNPNAKPEVAIAVARVRAGDSLEVSWKDSPGNDKDYIGIYKADEPDLHHYLTYLYTDGNIDGNVTFKSTKKFSKEPGEYVARLMIDDGYQELASARFWVVAADGKPQVAVAKARVKSGDPIELHWTSAPANERTLIGIYKVDDPDLHHPLAQHLDTGATTDGVLTFKAGDFSSALEPGEYKVRLLREDGSEEFASAQFQVLDPNALPQVTVVKTPVKSGEPVTVSWKASPGNQQDWIGIYKASESDPHRYITWLYTGGLVDGAVAFSTKKLQDKLPPGDYRAALLLNNGYDEAASATFTVSAP